MSEVSLKQRRQFVRGTFYDGIAVCKICNDTRISNIRDIHDYDDENEHDSDWPNRGPLLGSKRPLEIQCDESHSCCVCDVDIDFHGIVLQFRLGSDIFCNYCSVTCAIYDHVEDILDGKERDEESMKFESELLRKVENDPRNTNKLSRYLKDFVGEWVLQQEQNTIRS